MAIPIIGAVGSMAAGSAAGGGGIWASLGGLMGKSAGGSGLMNIPGMFGGRDREKEQMGGTQGAASSMDKLNAHQNMVDKVNSAFAGLKTFGTAFRGADKTVLNNIPRNQPPIIYPQNNQNPGVVALMDLMNYISRGQ